jgi:hypothetical protein
VRDASLSSSGSFLIASLLVRVLIRFGLGSVGFGQVGSTRWRRGWGYRRRSAPRPQTPSSSPSWTSSRRHVPTSGSPLSCSVGLNNCCG